MTRSGTPPLLETVVNCRTPEDGPPSGLLEAVLDFAYRGRRKKPATLDLLIADDAEMAGLNRRHLGKDSPTDVLAFDDGEEDGGRVRLGDVAIGADTARREAAARGVPYEHELVFYALHGLLHLLGMRDDADAERAGMHRAQARIMREFGLDVPDAW